MDRFPRLARFDPVLLVALAAAALFCFYGIHWGRVECWNRDQMAMRDLHGLRPNAFTKPPFHTYLNHLLVLIPLSEVERVVSFAAGHKVRLAEPRLLGSRLLTMALFLGSIALLYAMALRFYGKFAARILALLVATSAGFVSYAHFLSADPPLVFWMLAAFYFAHRIIFSGKTRDYLLAGLVTGLATATKYNGLGVGIAIVVAHLLSPNCRNFWSCFFDWRVIAGVLMVPIGFIAGNPYCIIEHERFIADFMYGYIVTPRYEGQNGNSYDDFLRQVTQILGWPGALLFAMALIASAVVVFRRKVDRPTTQGFLLAGSVAVLYYLKIGAFPRMPTRFVLPAVPFIMLMAGPFLQSAERKRALVYAVLVPLLCYNAICSVYVGKRFSDDPRLAAQTWMLQNVPRGKIVESSPGSPHWERMPQFDAVEQNLQKPRALKVQPGQTIDYRLPVANGRAELFGKIFAGNPWVENRRLAEGQPNESLFTPEQLAARKPDFISVYSSDMTSPDKHVSGYYQQLLDGKLGYRIAFDGKSPKSPRFIYPEAIDFLAGRITILVPQ